MPPFRIQISPSCSSTWHVAICLQLVVVLQYNQTYKKVLTMVSCHLPSGIRTFLPVSIYILVVNNVSCLHSGWAQRRLPSMDTDDFETIPSSAEESSNSSEEEGNNKNVSIAQDCSSFWPGSEGKLHPGINPKRRRTRCGKERFK